MSNQPLVAQSSKKKLSQFLSAALAFTTTVSLSGFALLFAVTASAQVATLSDGDLVRGPDGIKVYIVKPMPHGAYSGWKRHIFNPAVFGMYGHLKWSNIKSVNQATIDAYHTSDLYRADGDAKVFSMVEAGDSATKRWIENEAAFVAGGYSWDQIFIVNKTEKDYYAEGTMITTTPTTTTTTTTTPTGTGLTVSLASNTPAAGSLVADATSGDGAQAQASMLAVNFSAGSDGDVKVTTLKLKRNGISADADIANAYLYDGMTRLAEMTNISSTMITFTSSAGLFTVAKGTTKAITVKIDVTNGTTAGKTIALSVNAASDVVAGTATVSGTFPIMGAGMTTANVGDLGKVTIANITPGAATTVDPGQTNYEAWRFSVASTDQKISVSSIKLTNVGSVSTTDLINVKLMDGATQLGATVANLAADATASFDLSAAPLKLTAGQTKNISVKADIVGGTNRTYRFSIQRSADLVAMDENYGVFLKPNQTDSFAIIQAGGATTINAGSLTISVDAASPNGNVARDYIDQEFARFTFKASGEAVKVTTLSATSTNSVAATGLNDLKLYLDGTQVGSTADSPVSGNAVFNFGNSFIIPSGTTKTLVVKAEVKKADGTSFSAGNTITVKLVAGSSNAQGQTSLSSISTSAANGNTLTVQTGVLTTAVNSGLSDATSTLPTGVKGATNAKIASFALTAGAGESVSVSQIVVKNSANAALALGNDFQNLILKNGSTTIGTTIGSLSTAASNTYTFTPSPAINVAAGQQYVVDVYADILTGASNVSMPAYSAVILDSVAATGNATNNSANPTTVPNNGQLVFISASGTLTVAAASDMPITQNRAMGEVGQTLATFKLTTGPQEAVSITKLIVTDTLSGTATAATGSVINLKLFKADGTQVGTTVVSMTASAGMDVIATFDGLTLSLLKDSNTVLTLKGDINAYPNAVSGSAHKFSIAAAAAATVIGGQSGVAITPTLSSAIGTNQRAYRSELTITNAMTNISGGQNTDQNVGKYRFTNTSAGNYSITVSDLDLLIGSTIDVTGTTKYVTLRRDSVGGTVVAKKGASAAADFVNITDWTQAAGDTANEVSFVPFAIDASAGTGFVDIYVTADTNTAIATKNFSTTIGGTTPVTWSDGVSSGITTLDNAPISGANIAY